MHKILIGATIVTGIVASIYYTRNANAPVTTTPPPPAIINEKIKDNVPPPVPTASLTAPISRALERVTKKPFGLYVTPKNSPVSPEKFTGYHSGVDFETFPEEQNSDVPITAICTGPLKTKRTASGYGGVVVQSCTLNEKPITVIYGHLKLASVAQAVGTKLNQGEVIGVLGKGYSSETDGERKHLHLGIYNGDNASILGYVQKQSDLANWLDITKYLQ